MGSFFVYFPFSLTNLYYRYKEIKEVIIMYYSAGTYESFAHPEKPEGVDKKSAYIIGTGLAGLTAAFYLVRDGQMKGEHIHLLEKLTLAGGSCDGRKDITKGFFMRGGREMDNHFEVMWDMFRDVPSMENPEISVLDEYYWLNKHDPNYSLCRATVNRGQDAHTDKKFGLDKASAQALSKLFITPEKELEGKKISEVLRIHSGIPTSGSIGRLCLLSSAGQVPWR